MLNQFNDEEGKKTLYVTLNPQFLRLQEHNMQENTVITIKLDELRYKALLQSFQSRQEDKMFLPGDDWPVELALIEKADRAEYDHTRIREIAEFQVKEIYLSWDIQEKLRVLIERFLAEQQINGNKAT